MAKTKAATMFTKGHLLVVELDDKTHRHHGCVGVVKQCTATHVTMDLWSFLWGAPTAGVLVLRLDKIAAARVYDEVTDETVDAAAAVQTKIRDGLDPNR